MTAPETRPQTVTYRCLGVQPVTDSYGKLYVRLAEYDPARPDKKSMASWDMVVPDSGPWSGLEVGDLIEVTRVAKPGGGE